MGIREEFKEQHKLLVPFLCGIGLFVLSGCGGYKIVKAPDTDGAPTSGMTKKTPIRILKLPQGLSIYNHDIVTEFNYYKGKEGLTTTDDVVIGAGTYILNTAKEGEQITLVPGEYDKTKATGWIKGLCDKPALWVRNLIVKTGGSWMRNLAVAMSAEREKISVESPTNEYAFFYELTPQWQQEFKNAGLPVEPRYSLEQWEEDCRLKRAEVEKRQRETQQHREKATTPPAKETAPAAAVPSTDNTKAELDALKAEIKAKAEAEAKAKAKAKPAKAKAKAKAKPAKAKAEENCTGCGTEERSRTDKFDKDGNFIGHEEKAKTITPIPNPNKSKPTSQIDRRTRLLQAVWKMRGKPALIA